MGELIGGGKGKRENVCCREIIGGKTEKKKI